MRFYNLGTRQKYRYLRRKKKGDGGPLTVIARHPKSKASVIKCYESDEYQI